MADSVVGSGVVVHEVTTPLFPIQILKGTDTFQGVLPPLMSSARKPSDHAAFVSKKRSDYKRSTSQGLIEVIQQVDAYANKFNSVYNIVQPLLTDYDKEHVMTATVGLGFVKPCSTDLDNVGYVGIDTDQTYPDDVVRAVIDDYRSRGPFRVESSLSLPRNRFIGYPFMIGGGQRELNDIFLALSAAIVTGVHTKGGYGDASLDAIYDQMRQFHGDPMAMQGTRYQTTAKEIALVLNEGIHSCKNAAARPRSIQMMDKLSVMDIRAEIKTMLEAIKAHPCHTQDRAVILNSINGWLAAGMTVISMDWAKFDYRHGGERGLQQLYIHSEVIDSPRYLSSATTAFKVRSFTYGHGDVWEIPGDAALKSGMGTTTLVGCTGNYTGIVAVLSLIWGMDPKLVIESRGSKWDALIWGDDTVLALKEPSDWDRIVESFPTYKLSVVEEPTIKYLGSNYAAGPFKGTFDRGYSVGRFFQQQFFPERAKLYPFNIIGYIARLDLMGDKGREMHERMMNSGIDMDFRTTFKYEDRHGVLRNLLPEIQKHSDKIGMIDDALQVFTHGLEDLSDVSDDFASIYYELLGLSKSADLTDPGRYLDVIKDETVKANLTSKITPQMVREVSKIASGDFSSYPVALSNLAAAFNLTTNTGSVVY